jgi:transposase
MIFLSDFVDFEIDNETTLTEQGVQLSLRSRLPVAHCPLCDRPATRTQSRYFRTLSDFPVRGRPLQLRLLVRRFHCDNAGCSRRIFAERFPALSRPYAQRTDRLNQALLQIGLVLGGEAGAALAAKLAMSGSPDTILRLIKSNKPSANISEADLPPITKIGIDDWSWKRGRSFGTIIVDLESHKVVDLLADRTSETVKKWLQAHPQIEVISRDRSTEYALAATEGAPQAIQVADRFHVVKNLAEQVELLLARLRKEWRLELELPTEINLAGEKPAPKELPLPHTWKVAPSRQTERQRLARRAERLERYQQVVQLRVVGLKQVEIAKRVGLSERTVRKFLQAFTFPEARPRPKRRSKFDPYAAYVLKRWQEGQQDGHKLWQEIAVQGFKGTERTVQRFLQQLRDEKRQPLALPAASVLESLKARKAVWWFIRQPEKLQEEELQKLKALREASPVVEKAYRLVQSFMEMVHQLQGARLEDWLREVKESQFEELESFARGIEKDKAAVVAGLSLKYSNGPTEGHNHRLKLIKRSGYGRAKLELLKQRVLAQAA